ncbi:uncharacterized protein AB675_4894 [Cyphellophora attinorum]|uniref:Zn(2)-C6 fungal-type domain-containing protein n=1 Tax=Cyphellophora attinorum TaxID=1664694 RepID=A0A0N1GWR5_9EURO|nr:uncharacterized protein AB675_4894 [Phialophora attinorum]KPI34370.1 hypothetical protein AB675_4894 [Phialophora attinorum]
MDAFKADHVCGTCKTKKKRCDKILPICGYCSKRSLSCSYDTAAAAADDTDPAGHAPAVLLPRDWHRSGSNRLHGDASGIASPPAASLKVSSLDATINRHLTNVLQDINLPIEVVIIRFFQGFHKWLPIISPRTLRDQVSQNILYLADSALLLLTMALFVECPPKAPPRDGPEAALNPLFVFLRMLTAQVQTERPLSLRLLQTHVLLAAYEYASGRPEVAYVSLNTCVGMAQAMQIPEYGKLRGEFGELCRSAEIVNTWWAIVILQRLTLIECRRQIATPTTQFPNAVSPKPSDLVNDQPDGSLHRQFERQAEAAFLFDQFLAARLLHDDAEKIAELQRVDNEILRLLQTVMREEGAASHNRFSAASATIIRSLFALNEELIAALSTPNASEKAKDRIEFSKSAMHNLIRLVIDTGVHSLSSSTEPPVPCFLYLVRTAIGHAKSAVATHPGTFDAGDMDLLWRIEESLTSSRRRNETRE